MCLLLAVGLAVQVPFGVQGQPLTPELDRARTQPIIDGRGAAGIQLGDTAEAVITLLGGLPWKTDEFEGGTRQDFLYVAVGPQTLWTLVLGITFRQHRAQAIHIGVGRRPPEAYPYQGRTSRGYRLGESRDRLRALYGMPDEVIQARRKKFWWYQAAGLLVAPGEKAVGSEMETQLTVLYPQATLADIRRLLHLP